MILNYRMKLKAEQVKSIKFKIMPLFRLSVKKKFGVHNGKFAEPGMAVEVSYNGSQFPIGDSRYQKEVAEKLNAKYGIELNGLGQVSNVNFDITKL